MHRQQLRVRPEPHLARLHQADALDPARDDYVHPVDDDLLGGGRNRHQAGCALAIDRHACHGDRKPRSKRRGPPNRCLHALLQGSAHDDIVNFRRVDLRALDGGAYRVGSERRRRRGVERTPIGLSNRSSRGRYDHGIADGHSILP